LNEDQRTYLIISCLIILRMETVSDKSCRESQNTFLFPFFSFRKSCCLWDNVENTVEQGRSQMTVLYGTCALLVHAGYLRLRMHTRNI